jgi:hypothetical protein
LIANSKSAQIMGLSPRPAQTVRIARSAVTNLATAGRLMLSSPEYSLVATSYRGSVRATGRHCARRTD